MALIPVLMCHSQAWVNTTAKNLAVGIGREKTVRKQVLTSVQSRSDVWVVLFCVRQTLDIDSRGPWVWVGHSGAGGRSFGVAMRLATAQGVTTALINLASIVEKADENVLPAVSLGLAALASPRLA